MTIIYFGGPSLRVIINDKPFYTAPRNVTCPMEGREGGGGGGVYGPHVENEWSIKVAITNGERGHM